MIRVDQEKSTLKPAGYAALIERYGLDVIPNWHISRVTTSGTHRVDSLADVTEEVYPPHYWPGDKLGDHLEFALKYDGTNLAILARLFQEAVEDDLVKYVRSKPNGKYARRMWFFYEFLTGETLPLDDLKRGNYIELLEPGEYYTISSPRRIRRQRVYDNLLGNDRFCPTVRRTTSLREFEKTDLPLRCRQVIREYVPALVARAVKFLYTRETRSTFAIERITPSATRSERFMTVLEQAGRAEFLQKQKHIELQNEIVDFRFRESDYRKTQNYVGEAVGLQRQRIHFACPKPEDLADLTDGLEAAHLRMEDGGVPAAI
ncbi:MAG: cell filamentation protein Fic, partial [Gemmatimonadales bacterium]|nr:cell filamentation protein Fic [Gemmatimonadales bacterium]